MLGFVPWPQGRMSHDVKFHRPGKREVSYGFLWLRSQFWKIGNKSSPRTDLRNQVLESGRIMIPSFSNQKSAHELSCGSESPFASPAVPMFFGTKKKTIKSKQSSKLFPPFTNQIDFTLAPSHAPKSSTMGIGPPHPKRPKKFSFHSPEIPWHFIGSKWLSLRYLMLQMHQPHWLVVAYLPLWKMMDWKSVGMMIFPNWMEK